MRAGQLFILGLIAVTVGTTALFRVFAEEAKKSDNPSVSSTINGKAGGEVKTAAEFADVSEWINSKPLTMKQLEGKVRVVHFWTFDCINCIHNLPLYNGWHKDYASKGLVVIGVHTPELSHERDPVNVKAAVKQRGIEYPLAIDGKATNWKQWHTRYWPSVALVDRQGRVRHVWEGELNYQTREGDKFFRAKIEELLAEK